MHTGTPSAYGLSSSLSFWPNLSKSPSPTSQDGAITLIFALQGYRAQQTNQILERAYNTPKK